jgi:pseudouridine-5'-phosphate glycosidase
MNLTPYIRIHEDVQKALAHHQAVVALESTIISHGFNYPENLETALTCERLVREAGAVPATIGIRNGHILIGMSQADLEFFATHRDVPKASRRDVASLIALKKDGATTVATTMMFAALAELKVFATGGIGGVHREGETTMDVSADLTELANTPINVVCAGAKSILDLPRTKEVLETLGVPVLGYQTDAFPDFYTPDSGLKVDYRVDTVESIAFIIKTKEQLGLKGGMLIANPIPIEDALEPSMIRNHIEAALKACRDHGIKGKAVTPFLLAYLHEHTQGASVKANKALVFNNVRLAACVAIALSQLNDSR